MKGELIMDDSYEEFQIIRNGVKVDIQRHFAVTDTYGSGYWEKRERIVGEPFGFSDWERE